MAIGVACGLAAVVFHFSIRLAERSFFERAMNAEGRYWIIWGITTPALGGLAAGVLLASLGREGLTVQICCGLASSLGRLGHLSPSNRRRLIPVGAAAGIAAAFNAQKEARFCLP